jgi:hypothetical protein
MINSTHEYSRFHGPMVVLSEPASVSDILPLDELLKTIFEPLNTTLILSGCTDNMILAASLMRRIFQTSYSIITPLLDSLQFSPSDAEELMELTTRDDRGLMVIAKPHIVLSIATLIHSAYQGSLGATPLQGEALIISRNGTSRLESFVKNNLRGL